MSVRKNLAWGVPVAMLQGVLFGHATDLAFLPLGFLVVCPMVVTMHLRELVKPGGNRLQGVTLAINFVRMPAIGCGIGRLFFAEQPLVRLAPLLTALLPTSGMTISWTGFAMGNVPAGMKMAVVAQWSACCSRPPPEGAARRGG